MEQPPRILFITANRVGDAVLSTGVLAQLLATHPGARTTVACGPAAMGLFTAVPGLEAIIPLVKAPRLGHWRGLWRATQGRRWTVVCDLRGSLVGWGLRAGRRLRWTKQTDRAHRVAQLGRLLGLEQDPPAPRLWLDPADVAWAAERLSPGAPAPLVLGPTANFIGKQWKADRFRALAQRLTGPDGPMAGAPVAVVGAPNERAMADPLFQGWNGDGRNRPPPLDLFDAGSLGRAAAMIAQAGLYIGNDSGLMHIAAAAGVPTLGLFGPSPPDLYAPWGPRAAWVATDTPYPEHWARLKRDPDALGSLMDDLPVERAEAAARGLLARCASTPNPESAR